MESLPTLPSTRALSSESSFSVGGAADTFSNVASLSSTPPTTAADSISLASEDATKHENLTTTTEPIDESITSMDVKVNGDIDGDNKVHLHVQVNVHSNSNSNSNSDSNESAQPAVKAVTPTSTPPRPIADDSAIELPQPQPIPGTPIGTPSSERTRRQRASAPVYNLAKLSGTAIHGKRRANGDTVIERRRRTISGDSSFKSLEDGRASVESSNEGVGKAAQDGIGALDLATRARSSSKTQKQKPSKKDSKKETRKNEPPSRRISTRSSAAETETLAQKITVLGKRSRKTLEKGMSKMSRELRRLQDTNEYTGVDTKPVIYTTWVNGKYHDDDEPEPQPPKKKAKVSESPKKAAPEPEPVEEQAPVVQKKRVKKWLDRGLYAGQEMPVDICTGLTTAEKKKFAQLPELMPSAKANSILPSPIFNGLRILLEGRDFKLPFDICNPLPPGQPKPDEWRKMTKNRFVGDAGAYWKKTPHFKDYQSKCVCTPEDGCGESCQNRIMLYECDETNCNVGTHLCQNRAFARLQERTKAGGKFRVGVEVIKTDDRGYGIRSNRCFEPNQIIMEYTGEIITEEECDRRMNEKYKNNQCYYLMSFDQNMIIDATTGSIARFVNHSCEPNCRMIKWIVSGQPRMALFAGDRPISTGEELTYDYKFDPFSAKNVQKCLCGSAKCRGVLGPKPKEPKQIKPKESKEALKKSVQKGVAAGKRKLAEMLGDKDEEQTSVKQRKIKSPAKPSPKKITTSYGAIKAKTAAAALKRSMSKISANTKSALGGSSAKASSTKSPGAKSPSKKSPSAKSSGAKSSGVKPSSAKSSSTKQPTGKVTTVKKSSVVKTYKKTKVQTKLGGTSVTGSRKSSLTIVAAGSESTKAGDADAKPPSSAGSSAKDSDAVVTPRKVGRPRKSQPDSPSVSLRKGSDIARSTTKIKLVRSPTSQAAA